MNPPSALFGAMNRERKPFTYTPGGLDLSEIKSERMAKRLMRNAMNQGVPEVPVQQIQSPPATANPMAIPNFNCLPVQVFPTINLPANPKSLLRTRSNPDHPKQPVQREPPPSHFAYNMPSEKQTQQISPYEQLQSSPFEPAKSLLYEQPNNFPYEPPISSPYEPQPSSQYAPHKSLPYEPQQISSYEPPKSLSFEPQISSPYEQQKSSPYKPQQISSYEPHISLQDESPKISLNELQQNLPCQSQITSYIPQTNSSQNRPASMYEYKSVPNSSNTHQTIYGSNGSTVPIVLPEKSYEAEYVEAPPKTINDDVSMSIPHKSDESEELLVQNENIHTDFIIQPISNIEARPASITRPVEDEATSDSEQREVKVVKKQVKKEQKIENGDQNGDANSEAELVVKLPSKKSAAKTETKVEVNKTILPDGTIEEVKVTTTKTTIDGRTEIKTKTEKKIYPKEEVEEVEEEEEQEETEGEVQEAEEVVEEPVVVIKKTVEATPALENGQKETIIKKEERSETSTTKKVVVVQKQASEEEEEEEEEVEEPEPVVVNKPAEKPPVPKAEEEEVVEVKEEVKVGKKEVEQEVEQEVVTVKVQQPPKQQEVEEEEVEDEYEEAEEEKVVEKKDVKEEAKVVQSKKQEDEESEYTEEEYESEKEEEPKETPVKEPEPAAKEPEPKEEKPVAEIETKEDKPTPEEVKPEPKEEKPEEPAPQPTSAPEPKASLREPSIPLEKVEEVEIKPIGPSSEVISKTHTENTEIITNTTQQPTGPLSTQTEYSRVENIVTVNRTTKALDHSYEQITQAGVPTVRTYFAPSRERIGTSPTPSKPYQPIYTPEVPTERRHSLLLDRLSTERQMPSDIYQNAYQYNNQTCEQQRQWSQEPQSEVLTVSNVKPSKITNSQWYQQNNNVIYNNVTPAAAPPHAPTPAPANQPWTQPPPQQQYQPPPQQQYQPPPQQHYQPSFIDATAQERTSTNNYQSTNTSYPAYVPKPTNWVNNDIPTINTNLYSLSNNTSESYQKSTQQYSSSYVPPPWEQDSKYVLESQSNTNQNYYQPPPQTSTYTPSPNQGWKPTTPPAKFSKPPPTAYIPPAPNQSFVKAANVVEPPRIAGRKTYYSEYERRYITVPESTYIPSNTAKFQAQPDPSPQYYYDNNEPTEKVEHEWRKELREFTEKSSQIQTIEQTSVKPPWEDDAKYAKPPSAYTATPTTHTPTPTWSQTLRPRSWRERSFEAEYVGSQELPKTNTLGRSRPLSTYAKSETPIPERARGVSVDRYNPNNYQSPIPAEHPPVQSHTLTPTPPAAKAYHNPNVPAYHAHPRASVEPREQSVPYPQARLWGSDARGSPIQSRSFKYLQWMTGTDD